MSPARHRSSEPRREQRRLASPTEPNDTTEQTMKRGGITAVVEPADEVGRDTMTKTARRCGKRHDEGEGGEGRHDEGGGRGRKRHDGGGGRGREMTRTRRMRREKRQGGRGRGKHEGAGWTLSRANRGWVGEQRSRAMALLRFLLFLVLSIPRYIAEEIQPLRRNLIY